MVIILLVSIAASLATFLGGMLALRLRDNLHLILGFSAGAILAVAFFDLLPESIELGSSFFSTQTLLTFTALGFFGYMALDRIVVLHTHAEGDVSIEAHKKEELRRGIFGAGSLSAHSFLDGVAIGLAFQASSSVGLIVAAAIITHDFSDGINTVNLVQKHGGTRAQALRWLLTDATAPILGVLSTFFIPFPASSLSLILSVFAGFFLYIGASDLLPESHHEHPKLATTLMTMLGALVLYVAIHLAS
jgi:zinc transporter ZupT